MSDIVMLQGPDSQTVLQAVVQSQSAAIMSYLSKDKWHVAKVIMKQLSATPTRNGAGRLFVEGYHSTGKPHPINIRMEQPVGINFKHAYGKFVFDTVVVDLEPPSSPESGGTIVLAVPERIGVIQRRSYFRVNVPPVLKVNVVLWHRTGKRNGNEKTHAYYEGRLMDISAGGAQAIVPIKRGPESQAGAAGEMDFRKGQFMGVRFTPMPYETPLMFSAQIRNVLPTADRTGLCIGLQIVGLEASEEGREVLGRLANVVEHYHKVNQLNGPARDPQTADAPAGASHVPAEALMD
jgi:hypothetical protein